MPRNAKIFFNNSLHFITTSVEEGLMLPANPLIEEIVKKCAAQAQQLHPVHLSDPIVMATHVHFILQVIDPQDAADFMERFKCETAHAINKLLGKNKKTLWCAGYDSPLIEDLETAIDKIAYIYSNPSRDNLEGSIDNYPGFNAFKLRLEAAAGKLRTKVRYKTYYISRTDFKRLPEGVDYQQYRNELIKDKKKACLVLTPNLWMKRFGISTREAQIEVNKQIVAEVRRREEDSRKSRELAGKSVLGRERLKSTRIGTSYTPKRSGRRMLTHSVDPHIRKNTIKWMRALINKGKEVLELWRTGDFRLPYPLGLFPPTGIRLAEPIGW
jgi:REP element-mobilizing transposase RayT